MVCFRHPDSPRNIAGYLTQYSLVTELANFPSISTEIARDVIEIVKRERVVGYELSVRPFNSYPSASHPPPVLKHNLKHIRTKVKLHTQARAKISACTHAHSFPFMHARNMYTYFLFLLLCVCSITIIRWTFCSTEQLRYEAKSVYVLCISRTVVRFLCVCSSRHPCLCVSPFWCVAQAPNFREGANHPLLWRILPFGLTCLLLSCS